MAEEKQIYNQAILSIQAKKGLNIVSLDLRNLEESTADHFIICSAINARQIKAIAEDIQDKIQQKFEVKPFGAEGIGKSEWVVLDYIDFIVHIFSPEKRAFYDLESLWGDAILKEIEDRNL